MVVAVVAVTPRKDHRKLCSGDLHLEGSGAASALGVLSQSLATQTAGMQLSTVYQNDVNQGKAPPLR